VTVKQSAAFRTGALLFVLVTLRPAPALLACSLVMGPLSAIEITYEAEVIVRARAVEYSVPPDRDTGLGAVRFEIAEVLKGSLEPRALDLPGQLERYDGPNEDPPPHDFVRLGGRHGNCYARDYRKGQEYLLFMQRRSGYWTANWSPLAATNEEASAAWVAWTKEAISKPKELERRARAVAKEREEQLRRRSRELERRRAPQ
jgi:hypothetical protein